MKKILICAFGVALVSNLIFVSTSSATEEVGGGGMDVTCYQGYDTQGTGKFHYCDTGCPSVTGVHESSTGTCQVLPE